MMNYVELIKLIVKLNLEFRCWSNLCDYSDAYIFVATAANQSNRKSIIIKNCAPFTN